MHHNKWSLQEQGLFLKWIGDLLNRGYPLSEAIESVILHLPPQKRGAMEICLTDLREGYTFYNALAKLNFNEDVIGYVYFAEQHGGLADAFDDGSEMILKRDENWKKLKKLLMYPVFLILFTFVLFLFVVKILLPKFSSLFLSLDLEANFFTKIVYFFEHFFPVFVSMIILLAIVLLSFYFFSFKRFTHIKQKTIVSSVPILGVFFKLFYSHYFSVQLHYLLQAGLSVFEALQLFEKNEKQPLYQELGSELQSGLLKGEALEHLIQNYLIFDIELSRIIAHGQKNGKLAEELVFFSQHCMERFEEKVEKMIKRIQPMIYSFIGVLLVSMYLAVLLPMFHLMEGL
ncbi:competence type IV pilus assembly protein ComGB [Cytobacillus gottheilii]|uniref:competence type IV pilus assembly protein ComGB n=1 Tax=Cytobacillus gottheilii TaxID=859144 RepID=UPI0009BAD85C|nr:competence type IV pilus assembly protein ComGB [Cytobacillus gottheilii]